MNLDSLKLRASVVFLLSMVALMPASLSDSPEFLVPLIASIAGLALVMWMAATVADAMVKSLKKEK